MTTQLPQFCQASLSTISLSPSFTTRLLPRLMVFRDTTGIITASMPEANLSSRRMSRRTRWWFVLPVNKYQSNWSYHPSQRTQIRPSMTPPRSKKGQIPVKGWKTKVVLTKPPIRESWNPLWVHFKIIKSAGLRILSCWFVLNVQQENVL